MLFYIWTQLKFKIIRLSEKFVEKSFWKIYLFFILPFLALFFAFPSYDLINTEFHQNYQILFKQAAHPLTNFHYGPVSHEAKLSFRLFLPTIIHFFHLNLFGVFCFNFILGLFTYCLLIKFMSRLLLNKVVIFWICLAFVSIYAGKTALTEIRGYIYDGECVLFIMAALYFRNPVLIALFISLAAWNDERGLIATSLVFVWYWFEDTAMYGKLIRLSSIVIAWIGYFILRFYLADKYGISTPSDGADFSTFINNINNMPLGIWTALEGFWLLIFVSIVYLYKNNKYLELFVITFNYLLIIFIALCVSDITRSMMYLFPSIFISIRFIQKHEKEKELKELTYWIFILCAIFPAISASSYNTIMWQYPLPLQILRILFA